jgi:recombinational DNA repair ATPase RecF
MWVERVTARAFGGLREHSLELGPGLNVVFGKNEAGKSTWHAAIRMALTGVRRGPGSSTKEAAAVEERHRPWDDPDRWAVEARIGLADRRIDIVQDLLGKVACRATDVDLGVDVSAEITRPNGTPDASIWLGLDRDAFASTLVVGQGEMLAVADDAGALQEHMQRAAAAHGADATAAGAIERLREHRRRAVGVDRANAKGPLRSSKEELAAREEALAEARRRHASYLELQAAVEVAAHDLADAERRLSVARLATARAAASSARDRADRATALAARYPAPPPELAARDELADRVAAAAAAVRGLPTELPATGRPSAEIEAELRALPEPSVGDTEAAPSVLSAVRELELAAESERALAAAPAEAARPTGPRPRPILTLAAAAGVAVAAVLAVLAGVQLLGLALGLVAAGLVGWSVVSTRSPAGTDAAGHAEVAAAARARTTAAHDALRGALRERGVDSADDPLAAAAAYEASCRERRQVAAAAAARPALERELAAARSAESMAADRRAARLEAERILRAAAADAGIPAGPDVPLARVTAALDAWRTERASQAQEAERAIREYEELGGLVGTMTVADLAAEADHLEARVTALASAAGAEPTVAGDLPDEAAASAEVERLREAAAALAGALEVREAELIDVAGAEEAVAAARARLERVTDLAGLIDDTLSLLEAAQRQVHRDLAPMLAAAIREWLPVISGGAYTEAGVNPADLSIEVKERATGAWRQARLLSGGTREQVYLLLRIAMAQHLVTTAEAAPMILDEVTAQADADRREAILDMLLAMAADRQLILFAHDEAVLAWAERRLDGPHRIIRLPLTAPPLEPSPRPAVPVGSVP